ncbi:pilus assembly protein [Pseudomonas sp. CGJS7]|uniref:pilus assembly protein n=1 Tax=Pseudomonas sp. CGJS7 TaxID=3109348 RepID=UPI00300B5F29
MAWIGHRYLFAALAAAIGIGVAAHWLRSDAAQGDGTLAQAPLSNTPKVDPAFIMAIDDSGSMSFERTLVGGGPDTRIGWDANSSQPSFFNSDGSFYDISRSCAGTDENTCYVYAFHPRGLVSPVFGIGRVMPPLESLGFFRSPAYNLAYFNPAVTYRPWAKADGTRRENANPKQARVDPRINAAVTYAYDLTDISLSMDRATANGKPDEFFQFQKGMRLPQNFPYYSNDDCGVGLEIGKESTLKTNIVLPRPCLIAIPFFHATFYLKPDPSNPTQPQAGQLPAGYGYKTPTLAANAAGPGRALLKYEIKSGNFDSTAQYDAAIQNFANWFQYRRTRAQAMIGALTDAFSEVERLRAGYLQFEDVKNNSNTVIRDVSSDADRAALFASFERLWPTQNATINRDAAKHIGEQFKKSEVGAIKSACQKNIGLLFTDGYTTPVNSIYDGGPTGFNNADGDLGPPFADGFSNTLADIATSYYQGSNTPLSTDFKQGLVPIPEECSKPNPDKRLDCQKNLHVNFYAISLGANGVAYQEGAPAVADPYSVNYYLWGNQDPRTVDDGTVIDELWHATINTRGRYINAKSPETIAAALREVLTYSSSTSSPSSAIGSTGPRIGSNTLAVQPSYFVANNGTDWYGKLAAHSVSYDAATSQAVLTPKWNAETLLENSHASRSIYLSWPPSNGGTKPATYPFVAASFGSVPKPAFDALCVDPLKVGSCNGQWDKLNNPSVAQMIDYLRGSRADEGDALAGQVKLRKRGSLLGDIVNSDVLLTTPADDYGYRDLVEGGVADKLDYASYLKQKIASRKTMVYVGANDGMFHAFHGDTGAELFGYIPVTSLGHMANLLFPYDPARSSQLFQHRYFVDGAAVASDVYSGGWKTAVVASTGAGGKSVFALDVTNASAIPSVMWELTSATTKLDANTNTAIGNRMGNVLGRPVIVPVQSPSGPRWKAIFGNGYGSASGKGALMMVDMDGSSVVSIPVDGAGAAGSNGLGNIAVLDRWRPDAKGTGYIPGRDGIADTAYAGDQRGNLWKFDLRNNTVAFAGKPLFVASDKNGVRQPITGGLEVSQAGTGVMVMFGTGSYVFNEDAGDTSVQSVYGILDRDVPVSGRSELQPQYITSADGGARIGTQNVGSIVKKGWYLDLGVDAAKNGATTALGERAIGYPILQNGVLFFLTYTPKASQDKNSCASGGVNLVYGLDALSGGARMQDININSVDGAKPKGGTAGLDVGTANAGALKVVTSFVTAASGPSASASPTDSAQTSRCSAVIRVAGGTDTWYMPRPCGRQSWRQIR